MNELNIYRRKLFNQLLLGVATIPVMPATSKAQALTAISKDDRTANGLHYHADASTIDRKEFPEYEETQRCSGCVHFITANDEHGCKLMPGKAVNVNGWCQVWAEKP